jgi:hypothetical protein
MTAPHLEKIFYHYLMANKELLDIVKPRFFDSPDIRKLYEISVEFTHKYTQVPTSAQCIEIAKMQELGEELTAPKIEMVFETHLSEYDANWVTETVQSWIEFKNLDISVMDLISYLKNTKINAENIKDVVQTAKSIITDRNNIQFGFDEGLDFFNPDSHEQPTSDTFSTGYPYLDLVLGGGWYNKALFCFIGEMKIGKCAASDTKIKIRNKKTGLVEEIEIGAFHKRFIP